MIHRRFKLRASRSPSGAHTPNPHKHPARKIASITLAPVDTEGPYQLAFSRVIPSPRISKCRTAEASRCGVADTRVASTVTLSDRVGVRCFRKIVSRSVEAQEAIAASSKSKGLGALVASPSMRTLGPLLGLRRTACRPPTESPRARGQWFLCFYVRSSGSPNLIDIAALARGQLQV